MALFGSITCAGLARCRKTRSKFQIPRPPGRLQPVTGHNRGPYTWRGGRLWRLLIHGRGLGPLSRVITDFQLEVFWFRL